jgi:serine/threonine-protein kinase
VTQNSLLAGRYRLLSQLGTGGMSIVWQGFDELLHREVAVKVLKPEFAGDRELRTRILREAQMVAPLSHPHIAEVYDYGEAPSGSYVVMERVHGVPFADRLRDGPVTWQEAVAVGSEVASAMAAAHRHGVVHRDIKPANVMVTETGVKVIDFGISAVVGEAETDERGQLLGTLSYMAPERLSGRRAGTAGDVYSLGLMLYRAIAGELPWPTASIAEALAIHAQPVTHLLRRPAGVPSAVIGLLRECVQKDPACRPTMADLAELLADERGLDRTVLPFPDLERTTELFDYPTEGVRRPRRRWQPLRLGAAAALSLLSVSPRQRAS